MNIKIHTFGDSHAINGWDSITSIEIIKHHVGARLCYTIANEKNILDTCTYQSPVNIAVKNNDIVIFSFGEIDCRCHIHKHINETTSYETIIDSIVENYILMILDNTKRFENLKICVYNVPPPVHKHNCLENSEQPFLGSDEDRQKYVLYFNIKLKQICEKNNFIFFDIYNKYIDECGFLNKHLSDNNVHIQNGKFIEEFLNNIILSRHIIN